MKYIFTRAGKDGTWKDCSCSFRLGLDKKFVLYFDQITPEIGLNDGNFHAVDRLEGIVTDMIIDAYGICLEGCFININGRWHKDGFCLKFAP